MVEAFHYDHSVHYCDHPMVIIGEMNIECRYCNAKKFKSEPPGMCCNNGKVKLPHHDCPPDIFSNLMSGNTQESKHFLANIRRYNSCFQMTSFGTTSPVDRTSIPTTFSIQGQIHHKVGALLPPSESEPKFLQIYFMGDEELEVNQRCDYIPGVRREIVLKLQQSFHQYNHLITTFKTALEEMPTDEYKIIIKADQKPVGEHERRFNAPVVNEVAVVISADGGDRRDIILQKRGSNLLRIAETHRSYDALQYPIMFPRGEDGYHFQLMQINPVSGHTISKKVSSMAYYAYRIMVRTNEFNNILKCRSVIIWGCTPSTWGCI